MDVVEKVSNTLKTKKTIIIICCAIAVASFLLGCLVGGAKGSGVAGGAATVVSAFVVFPKALQLTRVKTETSIRQLKMIDTIFFISILYPSFNFGKKYTFWQKYVFLKLHFKRLTFFENRAKIQKNKGFKVTVKRYTFWQLFFYPQSCAVFA